MTVAMQLGLILEYFKTAFKDFKVFTGLGLHHVTISTIGWLGGWVAQWLVVNWKLEFNIQKID